MAGQPFDGSEIPEEYDDPEGGGEETAMHEIVEDEDAPAKSRTRVATVYDAAAGRIFLTDDSSLRLYTRTAPSRGSRPIPPRDPRRPRPHRLVPYSLRRRPLAPEEVLYRRKNAPARVAERDAYMAHERELGPDPTAALPDSDMLGAVHAYASRFYAALARREERARQVPGTGFSIGAGLGLGHLARDSVDERSMDETALLAFGILLEEAGREALGRNGDLVFTEGVDDNNGEPEREGAVASDEGEEGAAGREKVDDIVGFEDRGSWRQPKRRKLGRRTATAEDE